MPTIAAISGPAVGAGLNLALACGLRLVGESAYLRSMFLANDIHPAGGHLRMLRDLGGRTLAVRMAVLDEPLDAAAAVAAGLALGPYPDTELEAEAIRLAREVATKPALARWINRSVRKVANLDDAGELRPTSPGDIVRVGAATDWLPIPRNRSRRLLTPPRSVAFLRAMSRPEPRGQPGCVVRRPVGIETVAVPALAPQGVIAAANVLFVPEEPHVCSAEAQVLVPVGGGNEKVNDRFDGIEGAFADPDRDRLIAVGAAAFHDTVASKGCRQPERDQIVAGKLRRRGCSGVVLVDLASLLNQVHSR